MQGYKEYEEKLFVSFRFSERVPENNFYRQLKQELDLSFLRKMTRDYYGIEGQKSIDPVVFFKLMLIGYIENLCSDRKIIENASIRMDMLFFLGYDIDECLPRHSTLSRTRKLYGEDLFLEVFRKVLVLCVSKGMVNGSSQAIDSALVKSNASMDSMVEKVIKEEASDYLEQLKDNEEDEVSPKTNKPHTALSNKNFISPTDADARISKKKHKPLAFNYRAQISVDTDSHVICGAMADFADKRDAQSLPPLLNQTKENLCKEVIVLEEVLADTNYSSGDALKYLDENNIRGYIPCHGGYKPKKEGFFYFPEGDFYQCPQGIKLPLKRIRKRSDCNKYVKEYWTSKTECRNCPRKEVCVGKRGFKTLMDTTDKHYYDRMHERINTKAGAKMMKARAATVEPVLGTLLHFVGMKKVYTKGIDLANKHVLLASTAYNIKKLLRFKKIETMAKTAVGTYHKGKNAFYDIFNLKLEQFDRFIFKVFKVSVQ